MEEHKILFHLQLRFVIRTPEFFSFPVDSFDILIHSQHHFNDFDDFRDKIRSEFDYLKWQLWVCVNLMCVKCSEGDVVRQMEEEGKYPKIDNLNKGTKKTRKYPFSSPHPLSIVFHSFVASIPCHVTSWSSKWWDTVDVKKDFRLELSIASTYIYSSTVLCNVRKEGNWDLNLCCWN